MTVMLTGGAGFVGLNIAEQLLEGGADVVTYGLEAPPQHFSRRVQGVSGTLRSVVDDVRDRGELGRTMAEHGVTHVVHGAAVTADAGRERTSAETITSVNVGGTVEVLEAAVAQDVDRIILLGSGSVFGADSPQPDQLREAEHVPVPDSLYSITKYAAERIGLRYRHTRGLDVVVARLGLVFGRWEYDTGARDTLSLPLQLLRAAAGAETVKVPRDVPDDWVYSVDVAEAVLGLLHAEHLQHSIYQVSAGRRWSVQDWCAGLGSRFPEFAWELVQDRDAATLGLSTPGRRSPFSIQRLREEIGYVPRFVDDLALHDHCTWWASVGGRSPGSWKVP